MGIQTEKYMGRNQLIDRLEAQVGSRDLAKKILEKRGMIYPGTETLTKKGASRDSMTAEERALDRHVKLFGRNKSDYVYNKKTNNVKLNRKRLWI